MLIKKLKKTDKENTKPNPMTESEYCYYQDFGKVLAGLARALELRQGDLGSVSTNDILDYVDIDEAVFTTLFKDPIGVVEDVYGEIIRLFDDADKMLSDMSDEQFLTCIFKRFYNNYPMLDVLLLTKDHLIWENVLQSLVLRLAKNWPEKGTTSWRYLYENFCFQFYTVLGKWRSADYQIELIPDCVRLVGIWLEVNSMIGDTASDLLGEWGKPTEYHPAKIPAITIRKPISKTTASESK